MSRTSSGVGLPRMREEIAAGIVPKAKGEWVGWRHGWYTWRIISVDVSG